MKILHLYSDFRWTGPAEPAIQMCKGLEALGHQVVFACRKTPAKHAHRKETVEIKAAEYKLNFTTRFGLNRYWGVRDMLYDLWHLPEYIREEKFDVVHTHTSHDDSLGSYAMKMIPRTERPVLVKSIHNRNVLENTFWNRRLLADVKGSFGMLVYSESYRREYARRFDIDPANIGVCPMPLNLQRFNLSRRHSCQRDRYQLNEKSPLIGIVARFQKYRRMDVFLEAARKVVQAEPHTRFIAIGNSTHIKETVLHPMHRLGLDSHFVLTGYLRDNYDDMLRTLNIFTLMSPGFDATARALREAMALGKACVVSNMGLLPEIVQHGKTGLVFDIDSPDNLASSWLRLIRNKHERYYLGTQAADYAQKNFRIDEVGTAVEDFYRRCLARRQDD